MLIWLIAAAGAPSAKKEFGERGDGKIAINFVGEFRGNVVHFVARRMKLRAFLKQLGVDSSGSPATSARRDRVLIVRQNRENTRTEDQSMIRVNLLELESGEAKDIVLEEEDAVVVSWTIYD